MAPEHQHQARPAPDRPSDDQAVMAAMAAIKERLAVLEAEMAAERKRAQREAERLDQVITNVAVLKATVEVTAARPRPWWRRWGPSRALGVRLLRAWRWCRRKG